MTHVRANRGSALSACRLLIAALLVVSALVWAAVAGAGTTRGGTSALLDRTLQCKLAPSTGRGQWFSVLTNADLPPGAGIGSKPRAASIDMASGSDHWLTFDDAHSNVSLNTKVCHAAKSIPLTHSGLTSGGVYKTGYYTSFGRFCVATGSVTLRLRLNRDANGLPTNAVLAVRTTKGIRLILIVWSPGNIATYASSRCP